MSGWIHLIPVAISAALWYGLSLFNRRTGVFRVGEVIFWDAIILVVVFLVWLIRF